MKVISLEELQNRQTIAAVIYQLARGLDRTDESLLRDCFGRTQQMIMACLQEKPPTLSIGYYQY